MNATKHQFYFNSAQKLSEIKDHTIDLVVTSPPYPMIEMWDGIMAVQNKEIRNALNAQNGQRAFEQMHKELYKVWAELWRVVKPSGFACINIGDATRTIEGEFVLYPNHSKIIDSFLSLGWSNLPNIIWRKQTNAPNKFMGSGMLPAGAYVTLEHEWILIFRKSNKRKFKHQNEKKIRNESAYFWEERNAWFSDLWSLKGTKQSLKKGETRKRSAAFPYEIPYRLINMYSLKGDVVLDPFAGTGTTNLAAIACQRNSIGYEIDTSFASTINENILESLEFINAHNLERLKRHANFAQLRSNDSTKKEMKYYNEFIKLPVMTSQEKEIRFSFVEALKKEGSVYTASYSDITSFDDELPFVSSGQGKNPTLFG